MDETLRSCLCMSAAVGGTLDERYAVDHKKDEKECYQIFNNKHICNFSTSKWDKLISTKQEALALLINFESISLQRIV